MSKKKKPWKMGHSKHYKAGGHSVNSSHFTGTKGSGTKHKQKKTKKQRRMNRGTHTNKYKRQQ